MKLSNLLFASLAVFAMIGCESPNEGGDTTSGYTLMVDKQVIEASGTDVATFTVIDANGVDVTADPAMKNKIYFEDQYGTIIKDGINTFAAYKNGTWTFVAKVKGVRSHNTVTVTAQNRKEYEKFLHKICIYQCTGTWCGYCPEMTKALDKVREGVNKDNVIVLACHGSTQGAKDPYAIPYGEGTDLGNAVGAKFSYPGFPFAVYDLKFGNIKRTVAYIDGYIETLYKDEAARCGVKITKAQIDADGNGTIEASVKAQYAGDYDLAWAVLVDNLPRQGGNEGSYSDTVVAVSDNFMGMSDESKVTLAADQEYTKTFTFKVAPISGATLKPSDCKVVVMAHNEDIVDNANSCAVGSSVGYIYNE